MFNNPGKKLKSFAEVVYIIILVCSLLGGIAMMMSGRKLGSVLFISGILVIGFGILFGYIIGLILYAFGEIVDKVKSIDNIMTADTSNVSSENTVVLSTNGIQCENCGHSLGESSKFCPKCGKERKQ